MSAFPAFTTARTELENFIFSNFVPASGDVVQSYMSEFVSNASEMGAVGILSLLVVALMLILNIDKTLNAIWRSPSDRPLIYTFGYLLDGHYARPSINGIKCGCQFILNRFS